jgi:hypothetical protein
LLLPLLLLLLLLLRDSDRRSGRLSAAGLLDDPTLRPRHGEHDFNGDGLMDLLVAAVTTGGSSPSRSISIFFQRDDGFGPVPDASLEAPEDAIAYVAGRLTPRGGADVAWLCADGARFAWKDGSRVEARQPLAPEVETALLFRLPDEQELPFLDAAIDLDADGRDDLLLPGTTGSFILYQKPGGTFEKAGPFGPTARREFDDDGLRFLAMDVSLPACRAVD